MLSYKTIIAKNQTEKQLTHTFQTLVLLPILAHMCYSGAMPELETQVAKSLLPIEFNSDTELKREYLSWRICGFSEIEAAQYSEVAKAQVLRWLLDDEGFRELDQVKMAKLRIDATEEVMAQEQIKTARRVQAIDSKVTHEALINGIEGLSPNEMDYLKLVRRQHNPKVREVLGLEVGEKMPDDWSEVITIYRRSVDNAKSNGKAQGSLAAEHKKRAIQPSWTQGEYTEANHEEA